MAAPVGATATGSGAAIMNHGKIRGPWEGKGKEEKFSGGGLGARECKNAAFLGVCSRTRSNGDQSGSLGH